MIINTIHEANITAIQDAAQHTHTRGNGRRLPKYADTLAKIPMEVQATDTATHETECTWTTMPKIWDRKPNKHEIPNITNNAKDKACVVIMGNADGTGRPTMSKILLTADRTAAYGFATWSDMFGYPIKENAPQRREKGTGRIWLPLIKLPDTVRDLVIQTLNDTVK